MDCREPDESAVTDSAAVVTAALVGAEEWAPVAAPVGAAAGVAGAAPVATAAARGLSVRQADLGDSAVESGHLADWG